MLSEIKMLRGDQNLFREFTSQALSTLIKYFIDKMADCEKHASKIVEALLNQISESQSKEHTKLIEILKGRFENQ